jgi:ankyrin repeat and BTB/POZ domain-containing protein 1
LLLEYDYSKSTDPLQPFAAHISSLLTREHPKTADIVVTNCAESIHLHKFILAARSPFFQRLLTDTPTLTSWSPTTAVPPPALGATIKHIYLGEAHRELQVGLGDRYMESEIAAGVHEVVKQLEIPILDSIWERRVTAQRRAAEIAKGRLQLESWFRESVVGRKVVVKTTEVNDVKWDRNNAAFADVLLRADDIVEDMRGNQKDNLQSKANSNLNSSLVDPNSSSQGDSGGAQAQKSTLFPAHRAMLLRSGFFNAMFSSSFSEAQATDRLKIIHVDCSPTVLEIVLTYLYTEKMGFPLEVAVDVLFAADLLFIDKLKTKAAVVISSLGSGSLLRQASKIRLRKFLDERNGVSNGIEERDSEEIDIYDIIRAGWLTRVQRLEEFGARYLAYRLETHIDSPELAELIQESAARIEERQQTDSIELVDDIRFYLSERFRLRLDYTGVVDMLTSTAPKREANANETNVEIDSAKVPGGPTLAEGMTTDEASPTSSQLQDRGPVLRTLADEVDGDEFISDAVNYKLLMEKLDKLLEKLDLEA